MDSPSIPTALNTPEYRQLLQQCVHCGMCLSACPTYAVFGTEMDGPRGRITLMRAAAEGRLSQTELLGQFSQHINLCLACLSCQTACPSGVQYARLLEGAHQAIAQYHRPGLVERLVRWLGLGQLMPHVGRLRLISTLFWFYQRLGLQWLVRKLDFLPQPLRNMESILPPLSLRRLDYTRPAPAIGARQGRVAFFHGCIQDAMLNSVNCATVSVLQRNGYEVVTPQNQTCCGAAHVHNGDLEGARALARCNIDAFAALDCDFIISNAGGCGLSLKEIPELLHDDPLYAERAVDFARRVVDFSEFLADHLNNPPTGALPVRVVYSESCHLRHGQRVIEQPRTLLRAIPGLELVELRQPDRCCGSAGVYNIVLPDVANAVLDDKMADIAAANPTLVISSNAGCHMQLWAGLQRAGLTSRVLHIAEALELSYRVADGQAPNLRFRRPVKPLIPRSHSRQRWLGWLARRQPTGDTQFGTLKARLQPGQVWDDAPTRLVYALDAGLDTGEPAAVVFPESTADVQALVRWAAEHHLPLIARGSGSGLAGGAVAEHGGLLMEFSLLNHLLDLDADGRSAALEPGLMTQTLDEQAHIAGLSFPPDPSSGRVSTVGGNIATNAGGPHCFKYGVTANYVTGLDVVLADGRLQTFGGQALDYPEYDFVGLLTGSEGTLALTTRAMVALRRSAPAARTLLAAFDSLEQAGRAVSAVISRGLTPTAFEMMDQKVMQIVEQFSPAGLPVQSAAALILEVDGAPASADAQIAEAAAALQANGASDVRLAQTEAERARIWYGRKSAVGALARLAPAYVIIDGTVPRSRLAEALLGTTAICNALDLPVGYVFHAGDGNLHPLILIRDPQNADLVARVRLAGERISALCVELGGSITGEHGVGIEKRAYMPLMHTPAELALMSQIKICFDPAGLLNPHKILPDLSEAPSDLPPVASLPLQPSYQPQTAEDAAQILAAHTAARQPLRLTGATAPQITEMRPLSTARLAGIQTLNLDDRYVVAGAGTRLVDLQAELASQGVMIPAASPWPEATLGGVFSAGVNAPLRLCYGALRDIALALDVVLPNGQRICTGRPVMKNVAGYDLTRLFIGARGSLGLITALTLNLRPLPRRCLTFAVPFEQPAAALAAGLALARNLLTASAVLVGQNLGLPGLPECMLICTLEGFDEDVAADDAVLHQQLSGCTFLEQPQTGSQIWTAWLGQTLTVDAAVARLGTPISKLPSMVTRSSQHLGPAWLADLGSGLFYAAPTNALSCQTAAETVGGYLAWLGAPGSVAETRRPGIPEWIDRLKSQLDPDGILPLLVS